MLQFLPYALAAYGGYKGYKSSKDAGGSGLQRILAGVTGAAAGYYGGKGILGGGSAMGLPGFAQAQGNFTPFLSNWSFTIIRSLVFLSLGIQQVGTTSGTTPFLSERINVSWRGCNGYRFISIITGTSCTSSSFGCWSWWAYEDNEQIKTFYKNYLQDKD